MSKYNKLILTITIIFMQQACQLLDNSIKGTIRAAPAEQDQTPSPPSPIQVLDFTGPSNKSSSPTIRHFSEATTAAWTFTGTCDRTDTNVTLSSSYFNQDVTFQCNESGTFSTSVNIQTGGSDPHFVIPSNYAIRVEVILSQGGQLVKTTIFRSGATNPIYFAATSLQLQNMPLIGTTVVVRDIDFAHEESALQNWTPIGTIGSPFSGTIYGEGHVLRGIHYENIAAGNNLGFIGVANVVLIYDLNLENLTIRGRQSVGGLVGSVGQIVVIENSTISGHIFGSLEEIGGFVGNASSSFSSVLIRNSFFRGSVYGDTAAWAVGGLVGSARQAVIINSAVNAEIKSGSHSTGGLLGYMSNLNANSHIENCYFTGAIQGANKVGGLIGSSQDGDGANRKSEIIHSYAIANITATSGVDAGGLLGIDLDSSVTSDNSYYSSDTLTSCTGICSKILGTSQLVSELSDLNTYLDWDFINETTNGNDDLWKMSTTLGPPILNLQVQPPRSQYCWEQARYTKTNFANFGEPTIDGLSTAKAWTICSANQLNTIGSNGSYASKYFTLNDHIYLGVFKGAEFNFIAGFGGDFDGKGYQVSNYNINQPAGLNIGFIGTHSGSLYDTSFHQLDVLGLANVGGVVGSNIGGLVMRVNVTGKVEGSATVGGVAGNNTVAAILENISVSGLVTGNSNSGKIGGLAGNSDNSSQINYSYFIGQVIADSANQVGGLVGDTVGATTTWLFTVSDVEGSDTSDDVGPVIGRGGSNFSIFYDSQRSCINNGTFLICNGGGEAVDSSVQNQAFYSKFSPVLTNWNFDSIWAEKEDSFPTLQVLKPPH